MRTRKFKVSSCTGKKEGNKRKNKETYIPKTKKAGGGFLNRYDFVYTVTDVVNQADEVAWGVIKTATNDINNIAKEKIDQIICQGGKEVERILPKILRGGIEDVYQTLFRLLGNFGKQQLKKLKKKILH